MSERWPVPERVSQGACSPIPDRSAFLEVTARAAADPNAFWLQTAREQIRWMKEPTVGLQGDFHTIKDAPITWFEDGTLNVTESCVDRHAQETPDKVAILWEGDEPGVTRSLTYRELLEQVSRCANALQELGLRKGERAIIYMGMTPEAAIAMLACARIGAVHSVVFGGFSAEALRDRIRDCGAELVITQDEGLRAGRPVPLKTIVDRACEGESSVKQVLVLRHTGTPVPMQEGRDVWWHEIVERQSAVCPPVEVAAEDPLFILYTSGSTGKPKGLVHTTGGYLSYVAYTHRIVFDLRPDDIYACMADIGWVTGHSYIVYGPLANGATTFIFESTPNYPDAGRYWEMVERHGITIIYTAPTALRVLAAEPLELVTRSDRSSLRVLGTVGEPINPEAWVWYNDVVGEGRCAIVDTWWQTETGGILISPLAPVTDTSPGSATLPLPGILAAIVDAEGRVQVGPAQGQLCMLHPWPSLARTVWGDHERYFSTYFATYPGKYLSGDGGRRDSDGYFWITGRVDDVINVSGHRLGTAEFESALLTVEAIAEAAVVGFPHPVKGQGVFTFVVLQPGFSDDGTLVNEMNAALRAHIGALARLDGYQVIAGLPKTRSGKVMRRILRKVVEGRVDELGDISTLADTSVVARIVEEFTKPV